MSKIFSIRVVEERRPPVRRSDLRGDWYHNFLVLGDASKKIENPFSVVEQLHLNRGENNRVIPQTFQGASLVWPRNMTIFPLLVGPEHAILPRWNHGLETGLLQNKSEGLRFEKNYKYGETDMNCRRCVQGVVEAMGLGFYPEFTKSAAGLKASGMPEFPIYQSTRDIEDKSQLENHRKRNHELKKQIFLALR